MESTSNEEEEATPISYSRCVRCICYHGNKIYWGDDGTNLKMLEWTQGEGIYLCISQLYNYCYIKN